MKEDILEELVDGYFLRQPAVFTKHNVKYRPDLKGIHKSKKNKYSVHSDIDVLTINLQNKSVNVVSCKSWQGGLDVKKHLDWLSNPNKHTKKVSGREIWKSFRELTDKTWASAFRKKIYEETKSKSFTYIIAVTKLRNEKYKEEFVNCKVFNNILSNNGEFKVKIKFLTLEEMLTSIIEARSGTAIESTEIGRFIQLISAANLTIQNNGNRNRTQISDK